ncbi:MAG: sensor domain-containing diguanylate cyclase [Pseudomonadota bacterium]
MQVDSYTKNARPGPPRAAGYTDPPPEERFDRFTRLAAAAFDVPIALVCLVESRGQHFKSRYGLTAAGTQCTMAFCRHAVTNSGMLVVEDATLDRRFADLPLVAADPGIRFYAGQPIYSRLGKAVGTVCIIDTMARSLDACQRQQLADLGKMVEDELNRDALLAEMHCLEQKLEQLVAVESQLKALADTDTLTGLPNRRAYNTSLAAAINRARRNDVPMGLMYLDLDRFKMINDTLGHGAGDAVLQQLGQRLTNAVRKTDIVCRLAGDEFTIILEGVHSPGVCELVANKIIRAMKAPFDVGGNHMSVSASIGVAWASGAEADATQLAGFADAALYQAKMAGRNRVCMADTRELAPV